MSTVGRSRALPQSSSRARDDGRRTVHSCEGTATAMDRGLMAMTPRPLRVLRVDLAQDVERLRERLVARPVVHHDPLEHAGDRRVRALLAPGVVEGVRVALDLAAERQVDEALHERLLLPDLEVEIRLQDRTPLADEHLLVHLVV